MTELEMMHHFAVLQDATVGLQTAVLQQEKEIQELRETCERVAARLEEMSVTVSV